MNTEQEPRHWTSIDVARRLGVTTRRVRQLLADETLTIAEETSSGTRLVYPHHVRTLQTKRNEQLARQAERREKRRQYLAQLRRRRAALATIPRPQMLRAAATATTSGTGPTAKRFDPEAEAKRA